MKMKKWIVIIVVTILSVIMILKFVSKPYVNSDAILGRVSNVLNDNNKISLSCHGIDSDRINITWKTDSEKPKLIIKNGKKVGKIGYAYGPNKFVIELEDDLEIVLNHFKTNNWHSHEYKIILSRKNEKYKVEFAAIGPDSEVYERNYETSELR